MLFLSTSSARRTTPRFARWYRGIYISIHVLREEDDYYTSCIAGWQRNISIHVLREEDDRMPAAKFQT